MHDSIGRQEGDTLVADTIDFTDMTRFIGAWSGLYVIERSTRSDAGTFLYKVRIGNNSHLRERIT